MASDETPREIAEALVKTWHELPGSPDVLFTGKELRAAIEAALTAERARAERAERERDSLRMELTGLEQCRLRDNEYLLAERDTLRQHNAVLRAECQAGRDLYDRGPRRGTTGARVVQLHEEYDTARQQTDAAGAMGESSES